MELSKYPDSQKCRYYEIEAIQIPIVYNKYGDHDPDGLLWNRTQKIPEKRDTITALEVLDGMWSPVCGASSG